MVQSHHAPRRSEGRSFNPDEFAIALEQVAAGRAPKDYQDPVQFFARTCFTRALREHCAKVLKRLAGQTENAPPVLTLITQFGGGKTHTLTALYHIANGGPAATAWSGVRDVVELAGLSEAPKAKVAVFVGNAWDPQPGRETPWIDIARQIAGDEGVAALGPEAKTSPPGTEALDRVISLAGGPVLLLFDELLNGLTRHKKLAEPMHAFLHNIMRGFVGQKGRAAVISLPRSQVEMTDFDLVWQEKILKIVGAVAQQLIANDEAEISEVVRRRLFEDIGKDTVRRAVSSEFARWCFERRAQLPPEWTSVDASVTETKAQERLRVRFEACYPFHPATLSVFQRKWQTLPQFQQTRGTLAMLAQWISWAYRDGYQRARHEPLITLGSAPFEVPEFRATVLAQLGEPKLQAAIDSDISGPTSHARALDVDTKSSLKDIHRRAGAAVFFESCGGQSEKAAYMPDIRFALGEPGLDTTTIDNAVVALQRRGYYLRKVGADGFRFFSTPTLNKVVADRRAALDDEEVRRALRKIVEDEFAKKLKRGESDSSGGLAIQHLRGDASEITDAPRLTAVVLGPEFEWRDDSPLRREIAEWTKSKGKSPRLYPGALLWVVRKPGRDLYDRVETWLAWQRVERDVHEGHLGADIERSERAEVVAQFKQAEEDARDEVWSSYRFLVLADKSPDGLTVIDMGGASSSASNSPAEWITQSLRSHNMLNESPGAGYLERRWPDAFKSSGAWPLASLRQAFLSGAMERVLDVDAYLRTRVPAFVEHGDFGVASGAETGGYQHVWFKVPVPADEISFDSDVYLLTKKRATELVAEPAPPPPEPPQPPTPPKPDDQTTGIVVTPPTTLVTIRVSGDVPPEAWNRLGTKLVPKLKQGKSLSVHMTAEFEVDSATADGTRKDIRQALEDLGLCRIGYESTDINGRGLQRPTPAAA